MSTLSTSTNSTFTLDHGDSKELLSSEFFLYEINPEELKQTVTELASSNLKIMLENEVYESFLRRTDPKMLLDLEEEVKRLASKEKRSKRRYSFDQCMMGKVDMFSKWRHKADETTRTSILGRTTTTSSVATVTSGAYSNISSIPQINIRLKFELVEREAEMKRIGVEELRRESLIKQFMLEARIEKLEMSLADTRDAKEEFVNSVVSTGVDNITRRVTAEKFVGFMEKHLKKSGIEICLLNLKIANKRTTYRTVTRTLTQRAELAENKGILDMILLQRQVQSRGDELEKKVVDTAKLTAALSPIERETLRQKNAVTMQKKQLQGMKDLIERRKIFIQSFDLHLSRTHIEIAKASKQLNAIRERRSQFVHIDEMGYLHVKLEIVRLKKDIKNWLRRRKVQRANIVFSTRRLKILGKYSVKQSSSVLL